MSSKSVLLIDETAGKRLELPVLRGTEGEPTLDIKSLPSTLGYFTYDPGFGATASCTSKITFIDGDKGILRYRGYPIEQLAEKSTFVEVAYLLFNGESPTESQLNQFRDELTYHTMIHERLNHFISGFHYDAHPMAMMAGVVGSLAAFYHNHLDMENPGERMLAAKRMIAKMPTIAAACYRHHMGFPVTYPQNKLRFSERFLHMMFAVPSESYAVSDVAVRALDLLFILHAHELAHLLTSKYYRIDASLPYFIPAPTLIGTFGAFIKMRSPVMNKRVLLDVGANGPLAGLLVTIPILAVGLKLSEVRELAAPLAEGMTLGTSIILSVMTSLILGNLPDTHQVILHPLGFAGWIGLLVTSMNLIPVGQLDGGHIAYAMFGRRTRHMSRAVLLGMLALGIWASSMWLMWALILFLLLGVRHPAPLDYDVPLDRRRRILGIWRQPRRGRSADSRDPAWIGCGEGWSPEG